MLVENWRRVQGRWDVFTEVMRVLAKFAFQAVFRNQEQGPSSPQRAVMTGTEGPGPPFNTDVVLLPEILL